MLMISLYFPLHAQVMFAFLLIQICLHMNLYTVAYLCLMNICGMISFGGLLSEQLSCYFHSQQTLLFCILCYLWSSAEEKSGHLCQSFQLQICFDSKTLSPVLPDILHLHTNSTGGSTGIVRCGVDLRSSQEILLSVFILPLRCTLHTD